MYNMFVCFFLSLLLFFLLSSAYVHVSDFSCIGFLCRFQCTCALDQGEDVEWKGRKWPVNMINC